jgi:hypothetical protein
MFMRRHAAAYLAFYALLAGIFTGTAVYAAFAPFVAQFAACPGVVVGGVIAALVVLLEGGRQYRQYVDSVPPRVDGPVDKPKDEYTRQFEGSLYIWEDEFNALVMRFSNPGKALRWFGAVARTDGYNTSFKLWAGPVTSGKLFREREYTAFMEEARKFGLVRWKDADNTRLGNEFTPLGRKIIKTYVTATSPIDKFGNPIDTVIL